MRIELGRSEGVGLQPETEGSRWTVRRWSVGVSTDLPNHWVTDYRISASLVSARQGRAGSGQLQQAGFLVSDEAGDPRSLTKQEGGDDSPPAITQPDQDQLRRRPAQDGELAEVVILGRQDEPLFGGSSPDQAIIGSGEAEIAHVGATGEMGGQLGRQQRGQILVEPQSHAAREEKVRRSRSAA